MVAPLMSAALKLAPSTRENVSSIAAKPSNQEPREMAMSFTRVIVRFESISLPQVMDLLGAH